MQTALFSSPAVDDPVPSAAAQNNDIFGDFLGAPMPAAVATSNPPAAPQSSEVGAANGLLDSENLLGGEGEACAEEPTKKTNESIMALFGSGQQQQPSMYGVPGTQAREICFPFSCFSY